MQLVATPDTDCYFWPPLCSGTHYSISVTHISVELVQFLSQLLSLVMFIQIYTHVKFAENKRSWQWEDVYFFAEFSLTRILWALNREKGAIWDEAHLCVTLLSLRMSINADPSYLHWRSPVSHMVIIAAPFILMWFIYIKSVWTLPAPTHYTALSPLTISLNFLDLLNRMCECVSV